MTNLEQDFPRGGTQKRRTKGNVDGERNLFQINEKLDKRKKRRNNNVDVEPAGSPAKQKKHDDAKLSVADVQPLASELLTDPFKVLAVVTEVQQHQLLLSLPGGYMGSVPLTNISDSFSDVLQGYLSQKTDSPTLDFPSLTDMFSTGTLVAARITETSTKETNKKKFIYLSLNPKHVNEVLHLHDLQSGMVLSASVKSQEDHGYVMDLGIRSLHAFLRNEDADKFIRKRNKGEPLQIGRVLPCLVRIPDETSDGPAHSVLLLADPKKVTKAVVQDESRVNLRNLIPGMQVAAKVTKVCPNGLCVSLGQLQGLVYKFHLRHAWDLPSRFSVGDTVVGLVLFVHPLLKMFYMNLQTHLDMGFPKDLFSSMKRGDVVNDGVVTGTENGYAHFKLADSHHAVCSFKDVPKSGKNRKRLSKRFGVGSTHKCRIVKFARLDNIVVVDADQENVEATQVSYETLKPGDTVECVIKRFPKTGIEVQVGPGVTGFIPYLHTADYPLQALEKQFRVDQKLTCRVITVDAAQHQLILTNKRTLIKSVLPPLTSYADAHPGLVLQGIVGKVLGSSLLLIFYNDVKGIVKADDLQHVGVTDPNKDFYIGQVVTCQVIRSFQDTKKLFLTLRDARAVQDSSFDRIKIGKIYECEVVAVSPKGLTVKIDEDKQAYIPVVHLSDHIAHCHQLLVTFKEGDVISEAVGFLNLTVNVMSLKPSLLVAAKSTEFPSMPEMLKVGSLAPCILLPPPKKVHVGASVHLPGGTFGSISRKHFPAIADEADLIPGLSLVGRVKKILYTPELRVHLDASLSSCCSEDTTPSVQLLEGFVQEQERIHQFYQHTDGPKKTVASMHVGDLVNFSVTRQTEVGLIGRVENNVPAVCQAEFSKDVACDVGVTVTALVVNVDLVSNCVELDLRPRSIKYVQRQKNRLSQVKAGQVLNADALLIKPDYVLMMLKGHAWGHLAYIPTRKHLNDLVSTKDLYTLGESYKVEIKSVAPRWTIAVLHAHEHPKESSSKKATIKNRRKSLPAEDEPAIEVGNVYTAKIKSVAANHVNLVLPGNIAGRAFITDLVDDIQDGENPLSSFYPELSVRVRVIATRIHQSYSDLPISRPAERMVVDCSLKPSVVSGSSVHQSDLKLCKGEKVLGFVKQIAHSYVVIYLSPTVTGKVDLLNVSDNPKAIKDHEKWLKVGGGYHATVLRADSDNIELTMNSTTDVENGSLINGWVVSCRLGIGALLRLPFGYRGRLCVTDLADQYENSMRQLYKLMLHQIVRVAVVSVDTDTQMAFVSLRKSRLQPGLNFPVPDPELTVLSLGSVMRGLVKAVSAKYSRTLVTISPNMEGFIPWPTPHASVESAVTELNVGSVVTVKVKNIGQSMEADIELEFVNRESCADSMQSPSLSETASPKGIKLPRKRRKRNSGSVSEDFPQIWPLREIIRSKEVKLTPKRRRKSSTSTSEVLLSPKEEQQTHVPSPIKQSDPAVYSVPIGLEAKGESSAAPLEDADEDVEEESQVVRVTRTLEKSNKSSLPCLEVNAPFIWGDPVEEESKTNGLSSDEDEGAVSKLKVKSLKTAKDSKQKAKSVASEKLQPSQSAEELNRLVLASPNSSAAWLKNIAFYLENGEIDRARAIAEKALKIIHYREEHERLNVWVGMLNLENLHGTEESLEAVLERALKNCDPLKVYRQMANIYARSNKLELAEQTYNVMVKKFNTEREAWIAFLLFLMEHKRLEAARDALQRSLRSLPERHNVDMVSRMAQLEYRYGEPERGRTMFESTLANFPKRTDLWSVYIDMEVKNSDIDSARRILDRVTTMSLGVKQMKFFFKKYLDLEKRFGDETSQGQVKEKALAYVESKTTLPESTPS